METSLRVKKSNPNHVPLLQLHGVGKQVANHLARLNIFSIEDLLLHLPLRYQDRTCLQSIGGLLPGTEAVVEGIVSAVSHPFRGRTKLLCELKDTTGKLHLRFFHAQLFQKNGLKIGTRLRCYSEVRLGPKGLEMIHPEIQIITDKPLPLETHLTPIYPATEGLSQYMLRKLTSNALIYLENQHPFYELLPTALLTAFALPSFKEALQFVHRPPRETNVTQLLKSQTVAQKRLVFEELLAHRVSLLQLKHRFQSQSSMVLPLQANLVDVFIQQLPFALTRAQVRVIQEIQADLCQSQPMLRLVQGDVGSGKTVVAAVAMLQAVENNYQAVMMAPTELLAEQHARVLKQWFSPLGLQVVLLSGNVKAQARASILKAIELGEAQIIVGTHAVFQQAVIFSKLALIVVDEQHRFGVHQRALLREKGLQTQHYPHQLIMTATPIPRTLAMSFYADLDCSTIDELPPGRTPIVTSVIANGRREEVLARIREACLQGRQVYWVCSLIEESDVIASQAAIKTAEQLATLLQNEIKVGLIHGRMPAREKEKIMRAFQFGDIQLLVATTVIEVGVDVPNASVIVIENAERLGLAQLHQLRGRVGRGSAASHCVLLYQSPLSPLAKERLALMRSTTDGFAIAQRDLILRGPGEVLGTRQTGELSFRVADLVRDNELLADVHKAADEMLRAHPSCITSLIQRWIGDREEYGKV